MDQSHQYVDFSGSTFDPGNGLTTYGPGAMHMFNGSGAEQPPVQLSDGIRVGGHSASGLLAVEPDVGGLEFGSRNPIEGSAVIAVAAESNGGNSRANGAFELYYQFTLDQPASYKMTSQFNVIGSSSNASAWLTEGTFRFNRNTQLVFTTTSQTIATHSFSNDGNGEFTDQGILQPGTYLYRPIAFSNASISGFGFEKNLVEFDFGLVLEPLEGLSTIPEPSGLAVIAVLGGLLRRRR
ncbi:MAG: hypothetical protein AAGD32_14095 [Planctomycetota bacterium]